MSQFGVELSWANAEPEITSTAINADKPTMSRRHSRVVLLTFMESSKMLWFPSCHATKSLWGKKCNSIDGNETLGTQNSIAPLPKAKA